MTDGSVNTARRRCTLPKAERLHSKKLINSLFNGGNSNAATGDFSYGVEGFAFRGGKIVHPVREMVITGNFMELWNNLAGIGCDARTCMSKIIPSLAFTNVDFSA